MGKSRDIKSFESSQAEINQKLFSIINRPRQGTSFAVTAQPNKPSSNNKLDKCGGVMDGPIGNNASIVTISSGTADISLASGKFSGYVILKAETGTADTLNNIPAVLAGQSLWLQSFAGHTITISNSGNIDPDGSSSFSLTTNKIVYLKWDYTNSKWRQLSGGGGSGGSASFPIRPTITTISSPSSTQDLDLNTTSGHVFKITCDKDFTLTFSNPPASGTQHEFEIELTNSSTSVSRTVTLPSSVRQLSTITIPSTTPVSRGVYTMRVNDATNYDVIQIVNGTTGTSFANQQLSNLSSPVLNTDLNFGTFDGNNIDRMLFDQAAGSSLAAGDTGITSDASSNLNSNVPAVASHTFTAAGVDIAKLEESTATVYRLDMLNHTIKDAKDIRLDSSATFAIPGTIPGIGYDSAASRMRINVPTGSQFSFEENSSGIGTGVTISPAGGGTVTTNIINASDVLQLGVDATVPTVEGEIRNDGTKTTVFSGGAVRDMSLIGSSGATIELDNLGTTSINADLTPQAGKLLGSDSVPWSTTFSNKIRIKTAGTFTATENEIIADAATGMEFNTPTGDLFSFFFNGGTASASIGVSQMRMNSGDFRGTGLNLDDFASDPVANGEIRRNVNDVKVFSNSAVRNFSKMAEIDKTQTWTADQISDGLNDLGTTANPWNNIVSDNTLFCSNLKVFDTDSDINVFNDLDMQTSTTVDFADTSQTATAGVRTLPSNPQDFIIIKVNGVSRKVPFYAT